MLDLISELLTGPPAESAVGPSKVEYEMEPSELSPDQEGLATYSNAQELARFRTAISHM